MSGRDLGQFAADVGISALVAAGRVLGGRKEGNMDPVCGEDGGAGTTPEHRCACVRRLPHQADGADGPGTMHACACGSLWTDELNVRAPCGDDKVVQFKRFRTGPSIAIDDIPASPNADDLEPADYEWVGPDGSRERIHDITEVMFAPAHVAFLRDGELIRAVASDRVLDLAPIAGSVSWA